MRIHSVLSPKCVARPCGITGHGVFATATIGRGELIAVWGGKVYTAAETAALARTNPRYHTHTVMVYPGYFLASEDLTAFDDTDLFNHSCDPNVGVKGQVLLLARRKIAAGEEVTFDYETTDTAGMAFRCRCGSPGCRGTITGDAWLDPVFRHRHRGWLSWHISDRIRRDERGRTSGPRLAPLGTGSASGRPRRRVS